MDSIKSGETHCGKYGIGEPSQRCESSENRLESRPGSGIMRRINDRYTIG